MLRSPLLLREKQARDREVDDERELRRIDREAADLLLAQRVQEALCGEKLENLFKKLDTNHNGSLEREEFTEALRMLSPPLRLQPGDAERLFRHFDVDGDGEVEYWDAVLKRLKVNKSRVQLSDIHRKLWQQALAVQAPKQKAALEADKEVTSGFGFKI